jgi:hypothetical protein
MLVTYTFEGSHPDGWDMSTTSAHPEKQTVDVDEAIGSGWRFIECGEDLLDRAHDVAQDVQQQVEQLELQASACS